MFNQKIRGIFGKPITTLVFIRIHRNVKFTHRLKMSLSSPFRVIVCRYISEWDNEGKGATSNIRVTTKIGVHALLSKELKDVGSALIYNIVTKEVKSAVGNET